MCFRLIRTKVCKCLLEGAGGNKLEVVGGVLKSDSTQLPSAVDVVDHPLARSGLVSRNVCQHVQSIKIRLKENEIKAILVTYLLGHICMIPRTKLSTLRLCVRVPVCVRVRA